MRRPERFGRLLRLAFTCAVLAAALASTPVAAAGTLAVDPPSGAPGQMLMAIGSGFPGGQAIELRWDGATLPAGGSSADDGAFEIPFTIPAGAAVGGHELRACIRGNCSLAPPFTVAVTLAPSAGPSATPVATPPPASEPAPSASAGPPPSPSAAPTGVVSPGPVESGSPGPSLTASGEPSPAASSSGVIAAPSVAPTGIPAGPTDPDTFGRLKQAWPWLLVAGGGLGLALLALYVVLSRNDARALKTKTGHALEGHGSEKWLKGDTTQFGPGDADVLAADTAVPEAARTPKLYEAAAKGTHATPQSGPGAEAGTSASDADPTTEASKDVKVKGKKIGEN